MSDGDELEPTDSASRWTFPEMPHGPEEPEPAEPEPEFVTLCVMPAGADVMATITQLEAEGIPCKVGGESASASAGDGARVVEILVEQAHLEAAREAVIRPPESEDPAAVKADRKDREEHAIANWVCPKCGRRGLDLLPLSTGVRLLRNACLGFLLIPLIVALMASATRAEAVIHSLEAVPDWLRGAWVVTILVFGVLFVVARRDERCAGCGWQSGTTAR